MTTKRQEQNIPDRILDILKTSPIGYLSVTSSKGQLSSYPVAFYISDLKIYFMTPITAAKLGFIRANPTVSFLVDNHLLTTEACGAMIQGKAKVFSIAKTVLSILSLGPKVAKFAKKYPGMFTFYAKGRELPDERKLYKYRLIRIEPTKLVYWIGYEFGRYFPKKQSPPQDPLTDAPEDVKMEAFAQLLKTADEDLSVEGEVPASEEWLDGLETARRNGILSDDEHSVIDSYRAFLRKASDSSRVRAEVTGEERKLLRKWRKPAAPN
jgi:nitroimidazol reductase NimA-like FMN-containing flavoprotein (pyridoxamine 5'-phosphate oxidase superfamily)